jgi:hypothetical protein
VRVRLIALVAIVCLAGACVSAQTPTKKLPTLEALQGPLAHQFPNRTFFYFEAANLAEAVAELGGVERLHAASLNLLKTVAPPGTSVPPLPLTVEQFKAWLNTSIAIGVLPAGDRMDLKEEPVVIGVVRTASAEQADFLLAQILEVAATPGKPTHKKTVVGVVVNNAPVQQPGAGLAVARIGSDLVIGQENSLPEHLKWLLATQKSVTAHLDDDAGYGSVLRHVRAGRQALLYVNGPLVVEAMEEGMTVFADVRSKPVPGGVEGAAVSPAEAKPAPPIDARATASSDTTAAQVEALRSVLGLRAFRGLAAAVTVRNGMARLDSVVVLDRSIPGLLATLSDPPPTRLKAAAYLPEETDFIASVSIEPARLYDTVMQALPPGLQRRMGSPTISDAIGQVEAALHLKLREDLLDVLGNEVTIGANADEFLDEKMQPKVPVPDTFQVAGFIELKDRARANTTLARLLELAGPNSPKQSTHLGVSVYSAPAMSFALVDDFLVVAGRTADIEQVLDAHNARTTLSTTSDFAGKVVPVDAISVVYLSPKFIGWWSRVIGTALKTTIPEGALPTSGLLSALQKDATSVHCAYEYPVLELYSTILDSLQTKADGGVKP